VAWRIKDATSYITHGSFECRTGVRDRSGALKFSRRSLVGPRLGLGSRLWLGWVGLGLAAGALAGAALAAPYYGGYYGYGYPAYGGYGYGYPAYTYGYDYPSYGYSGYGYDVPSYGYSSYGYAPAYYGGNGYGGNYGRGFYAYGGSHIHRHVVAHPHHYAH
jgi:hypothetical protein